MRSGGPNPRVLVNIFDIRNEVDGHERQGIQAPVYHFSTPTTSRQVPRKELGLPLEG